MPWPLLHLVADHLHLLPDAAHHIGTAFVALHDDLPHGAGHETAPGAHADGAVASGSLGDFPGVDPEILKLQGAKVSVDLLNNNNSQYYGDFTLGQNRQRFSAVFDTGSGITWVPGKQCNSDTCLEHHRFATADSSSFEPAKAGGKGSIHYGTGEVKYAGGSDKITFCDSHDNAGCHGVQSKALEIPKHAFGMSTHQTSNPFRILPFDGILGLAPSKNPGSVLHQLKAAKSLARNMLGFYFSEDTHRSGSVSFGGVEPQHIAPNQAVHWHPITRDDEWQIDMKDISVNGQRLHICDKRPGGVCPAVMDTGSSLITGPSGEVDKLLSKIHTPDDCSTLSKLPNVSVILVDKDGHEVSYPLTPEEYTLRSWDEVPNTGDNGYLKEFPVLGHGTEPKIMPHCEPGVGIMDVPGKKWVLGDTLLRRYYSIYDDDRGLVGLVKSLHPDESAAATPAADALLSDVATGVAAANVVAQSAMGSPLNLVAGIAAVQRAARSRREPAPQCRAIEGSSCRRFAWTRFL